MTKLYTIGFTKKDAEKFFELLRDNHVDVVVDVRLNNVSQLAGFSKYPDIAYFVREILKGEYVSDKNFSPEETTLKDYKSGKIDWDEYVVQFEKTMKARDIKAYIQKRYGEMVASKNICFLCSEDTPEFCHRRLIAEIFAELFKKEIVHLV